MKNTRIIYVCKYCQSPTECELPDLILSLADGQFDLRECFSGIDEHRACPECGHPYVRWGQVPSPRSPMETDDVFICVACHTRFSPKYWSCDHCMEEARRELYSLGDRRGQLVRHA